MSFETLSERHEFIVPNFPEDWLPLIHLYDPDLPLLPLLYFHEVDQDLPLGRRPGVRDRVFGYIHHINLENSGNLRVCLATNKNLSDKKNNSFRVVAEEAAKQRLGLVAPVTFKDIDDAFTKPLEGANSVLREIWYQVVNGSFGKALPFGRIWDPVLGLARLVASFYSKGGRKGELIQMHDFVSSFGAKIQTGAGFHADFYLLPSWSELKDVTNPLSNFPKYAALLAAADDFAKTYCEQIDLNGKKYSAFRIVKSGTNGELYKQLNTGVVIDLMSRLRSSYLPLFNNYSAFNRGPLRSIISLLMLHDLRHGLWDPETLTITDSATMYSGLKNSYQSPKVIQLYAQQCFGANVVLPIDNWVQTLLCWPLGFHEASKKSWYKVLFDSCNRWGRVERLIWIASQARKVHSSVCADILWCIRYGDNDPDNKKLEGVKNFV
ncbi:MAG: hypothetical protein HGB32_07855 [Geobacteraceae bacterium]|nr:hypothetical protein [Geobacteraceae bacterium]